MRKFVPFLLILSLSCMPGGCQQKVAEKVVEKSIEEQTGGKVDIGSVKVEGEFKEMLYPGAKVDATYEAMGQKAMIMKTKDDPQKVMDYYVKKFGSPSLRAKDENGILMSWDKGITIIVGKDEGWTTITLSKGHM